MDPQARKIYSENNKFYIDLAPFSPTQHVYSSIDGVNPIWSFSENVWHNEYYISNDGIEYS